MKRVLAAVLLVVIHASAYAQDVVGPTIPEAPRAETVDPRFHAIENVLERFGTDSPFFSPTGLGDDIRSDGVSAMLRFRRELSTAELGALERQGVEFQRGEHGIVHVGTVYAAFVQFDALDALRTHNELVWAEVAWHPVVLRPLEVTTAEIGALASRRLPTPVANGEGAVIGDIDSGIDILHPHFFRADGGAFVWIDEDGDGRVTSGVDFIDLNQDGEADFNERIFVLDGTEVTNEEDVSNDDRRLDVARDWVYIDANGDGRRNVGVSEGFTERSPAYGEPIFVPDDANRDGVLQPTERFLRLKTSKVKKFTSTARTYRRGEDLIEAQDISFIDQIFHGSGVASILVGGHPGRDRAGIAPGADLIMYSEHIDAQGNGFEEVGQLSALQDSQAEGVDVVVHEWTNPTTAPLDGGGNFEEAMLTARASGVVQVNPLGNLNRSQKHIEVDVAAAGTATIAFNVGRGFTYGPDVYPFSTVYASLYWRGDHTPVVRLVTPDGTSVEVPTNGSVTNIGSAYLLGTLTRSVRGTSQLQIVTWREDPNESVGEGDWRFEVDMDQPDRLVGRITDYYSGWSVGVKWLSPTTDRGTVVYPATADAALGVAAYGGRQVIPPDSKPGELREYSGRGPRIDGARVVDLAAPDDPFAAWGVSPAWIQAGIGRTWFRTFGGTSGAGPHVAGTVALMRAVNPALTPLEIEERLIESARRDEDTPSELPDAAWGDGKLDSFAAVHGFAAPDNAPPIAAVEITENELSAEASTDTDGDELYVRWDLDYDGEWDSDWTTDLRIARPAGDGWVRVDVRDGRGGMSGAVLELAAIPDSMEPAETDPDMGTPVVVTPIDDPRKDRPCGCASTSESVGGGWLAFALLAMRRRRRS